MNRVVSEMDKERIFFPIVDNLENLIGESIGQKVTLLATGRYIFDRFFPLVGMEIGSRLSPFTAANI